MLQLAQSLGLDLADAFARHGELPADFFERVSITPRLRERGRSDFYKAEWAIRHGFDATIRRLDGIELSTIAAEGEAEASVWTHSEIKVSLPALPRQPMPILYRHFV